MQWFRHAAHGLVCLLVVTAAAQVAQAARDDQPASPLRLMPDKADVVFEIHQPRQLIEAVTTLDAIKQLQELGVSKEFLNSTRLRRFYQLVAYFEKELGAKYPELLDRLADNGAALGVKFGPDPAPALLVIQGKDEKLMERFVKLSTELLEQEIARQEAPEKLVTEKYEEIETYHVGKGLHAARVGAALLISSNADMLKLGLDLARGTDKGSLAAVSAVVDAHKLLPKGPLASFWLNMEPVRSTPQGKEFYKTPRDLNLTILAGSLIDVLSRTPYVAGGIYKEKDGFLVAVRVPKGREGMGPDAALHLAPEGEPGSRPVLEPRGVILSESFYLNVSRFWEDRDKFLGEKQAQDFEKFDKQSAPFLSGIKVSKLLQDAGAYHRIVVVNQPKVGYKTKPKVAIPAFAVVTEMRDPDAFSKSVSTVLRGAALLFSTTQTKMTVVEEKHGDVEIVGYRFPDGAAFKQDVNDVRYNFSPCFAHVGNQFMVASTLELGHELVDLLQKEAAGANKGQPSVENQRIFASGVAELLQAFEEPFLTQMILDQALAPDDAKAQLRDFMAILRRLGDLTTKAEYQRNEFHYDLRIRTTK
jgi:hypothetical protein